MLYKNKNITILFGGAQNAPLSVSEFKENISSNKKYLVNKVSQIKFGEFKDVFLHQTHSIDGKIFDNFDSFDFQGDYLITDKPEIGIGVLTADCLPVVFYDKKNNVIAIAHSGWKGSLSGIVQKVIFELQKNFLTKIQDLIIFLGPCAKNCCYEVSSEFLLNSKDDIFKKSISKKNNKLIFDNVFFTELKFLELGIQKEQINFDYNFCTICDLRFCSNRRDAFNSCRQATLVKLNKI